MATNGTKGSNRSLKAGIYAPIPTFFLENEDLDLESFAAHIVRVAKAGVAPVVTGSMGEAHHLSHSERASLITTARKALDDNGFSDVPLIAGTGIASTRETLELTAEAAKAGADFALVLASGYFAGVLAGNRQALKGFWKEVSEKSPIPVMIYNYPGASGGIDLDSDLITEIATECPNICGVKLTQVLSRLSHSSDLLIAAHRCGNVGKLTRIANAVADPNFTSQYPRKNPQAPFLVLGGFIDFLTPSAYANGHGAITGLANVAPYTIKELFRVTEAATKDLSHLPEAQRLQGIVARGDYTIAKASIAGTKYLVEKLYGYGGLPRRPLPPIEASAAQALWEHPHTQDLVRLERELSGKVKPL